VSIWGKVSKVKKKKKKGIEAISMGVETHRGYNLDMPPVAIKKLGTENKQTKPRFIP
jgi:hypothetical protein